MVTDYLWITFTTLYHCVSTYLIWKPMSVVQLGKTEVNHQSFEISEMLTLGLGKQSCVTLKMWWSWHGETNKQWKWTQHAMRTTWKKLRYGREATKKKLQSKNQHALWNTIMQWMELTNWIKTLGTTLLSGSHTSGQRNLSHICFRSVCSMLLSFTKQKNNKVIVKLSSLSSRVLYNHGPARNRLVVGKKELTLQLKALLEHHTTLTLEIGWMTFLQFMHLFRLRPLPKSNTRREGAGFVHVTVCEVRPHSTAKVVASPYIPGIVTQFTTQR